jgi:hypothetical protein
MSIRVWRHKCCCYSMRLLLFHVKFNKNSFHSVVDVDTCVFYYISLG